MGIKLTVGYVRPEMWGTITLEPETSCIDWQGMAETAFFAVGFLLMILFGDGQMWASFIAAFIAALVFGRL